MSKIFREYKKLDLSQITIEISQYWKKHKIFQNNSNFFYDHKKNTISYILYEGPPSLNGNPGVHHIITRIIKDIFCRYHTLKGKKVFRKAGWDTHGLPVELNVEKYLGITKNDIGKKISIEKYNNFCKSFVNKSLKKWQLFTEKIGYFIDLDHSFITYNAKYIESVWWLIKKLYDQNLLYKGLTIQPYSPAAGTGLSYHELNMTGTYKEVKQLSPFLKFKAIKNTLPKKFKNILGDIYFISWTTAPWTIPSNTALAFGYEIDYVLIKTYNTYTFSKENIVFSEKLIHKILLSNQFYSVSNETELDINIKNHKIPYLIVEKFKGKELIYSKYEQLLPWFKPYYNEKNAFQIITGDFVNVNEGTGIVHISPTFGIDDFIVAKKYNIPPMLVLNEDNIPVSLVDFQGKFIKNFPHGFSKKYVKNEFNTNNKKNTLSVDQEIIFFLEKEQKIFRTEKHVHFYPHCWRTEKPILYYLLNSWFIKTTEMKDKMISLNQKIQWYPDFIGKKRFDSWLKNTKDWNLSRSRYWGTPLPIWRTEKGDEEIVIGSIKELLFEIKKSIKYGFMSHNVFKDFILDDMSDNNYDKIDLHKHILDKIILVSPKEKPMKRESDLVDVWFDSGAMPYAQFHYPFENKEYIDKNLLFPADFISEGIDQTRGWFFTLHTISSLLFNSIAYKNVVSTGLILDKNGRKMSKSKGNTINPFDLIDSYGPDAIRWYIIFHSEPWDNLKFNIKDIHTIINKFFGTLYNIYSFFVLYANIDGFSYKEEECFNNYTELDFWILSELNTLIKKTDNYYTNYNPTKASRLISSFVLDKLSNWYVRLCRRRFWKEKYTKNKISAYQILYKCLIVVAKLISPIVPFFSEKLYVDLNSITEKENFKSIHLTSFPSYNYNLINKELENKMFWIQKIISMVFSIRKKNKIKIRQPLQKLLILVYDNKMRFQLKQSSEILFQEANVKKVEFPSSYKNLEFIKHIKPNYKSIGPKFGNKVQIISEIIKKFNQEKIREIEKNKKCILFIKKEKVILSLEDVKITTEYIKNWSVLFDSEFTIALDLRITNSLWEEGFVRELIRHIQKLRKNREYNVIEKIFVYISVKKNHYFKDKVKIILQKNKDFLCKETLAVDVSFQELQEYEHEEKEEKIYFEEKFILYMQIRKVENIKK
ncbi:isoleucine--tRNA ligase [Blattabacterium sp. (Blaberus giganteus)]|uniref:isoleucine--tRNA ligase n=1 Tax=Blattabacterium sp. (Blaberus giganteus) TaxID=1186051 RepID=UPI00025F6FD7|nr:isoleucine--tRNA ligase [Blattabacterium sp. (Blaberus giganteus)]AFJ90894.1 isoleucine-tRNA ligase [Blattabacterium sp. (Blaberus giganteus)]